MAISNAGAVAFSGIPVDGSGEGVFVAVKGKVRNVASTRDGLFAGFGLGAGPAAVGIDDAANVVFPARLAAGGYGLYIGPSATDRIIGSGDALFGSTVTELRFSTQAVDAGGNVTFGATLADGRSVIALAALPEAKSSRRNAGRLDQGDRPAGATPPRRELSRWIWIRLKTFSIIPSF